MSKFDERNEKKARVFLGREAWIQHIRDYRKSGLTQPEYAKKHNLNTATFRNWITKLKREERATSQQPTAFVPVKVNPTVLSVDRKESNPDSSDLHIRLPNGIECTFPSNHAPSLIVPWIEYLRVLP